MAVEREVKYDMLRRLRLADYLTLSNALCGGNDTDYPGGFEAVFGFSGDDNLSIVLAIFSSLEKNFVVAHFLIFLGYEFDRFDGIVARWRNECSELGKQLDSLSDLVTFIVTPAIMLYSLGFQTPVDQLVLVFWVLCGVARLARFNVTAHLVPRDENGRALHHVGLAVPYAALVVSTAVAVQTWTGWASEHILQHSLFPSTSVEFHPTLMLMVVLGAMMISKRLKVKFDGGISIPAISVVILASCWWLYP